MIKVPQIVIEGSFSMKLIKIVVKFWLQFPSKYPSLSILLLCQDLNLDSQIEFRGLMFGI